MVLTDLKALQEFVSFKELSNQQCIKLVDRDFFQTKLKFQTNHVKSGLAFVNLAFQELLSSALVNHNWVEAAMPGVVHFWKMQLRFGDGMFAINFGM